MKLTKFPWLIHVIHTSLCYPRRTMSEFSRNDPEFSSVAPSQVTDPARVPQFATAEYAHTAQSNDARCRICSNLISGDFFRINNQMACANCAQQARAGQPADSHSAFVRGLLLGIGGAILGLILYSAVAIGTGWT